MNDAQAVQLLQRASTDELLRLCAHAAGIVAHRTSEAHVATAFRRIADRVEHRPRGGR